MAKSYFSHDSNAKDDPKIIKLIDSLGLEGYGAFWVLIESLREQPNLRLPIIAIPRLSRTFGITQQKLEAVIKSFELFEDDGEFFYSASLLKRMNEASERGREAVNKRYNKIQLIDNQQKSSTSVVQSYRSPILLNEIKVNEIKEEDIITAEASFTQEQMERFKKLKKWISENTPRVSQMKEPIQIDQYFRLLEKGFNSESLINLLASMHNYEPLLRKNRSTYLTILNWSKRETNAK